MVNKLLSRRKPKNTDLTVSKEKVTNHLELPKTRVKRFMQSKTSLRCGVAELTGQLFESAFDSASSAMMIIDNDYRIVAFNSASESLTKISSRQAIGKRCWEVYLCNGTANTFQGNCSCPLELQTTPSSCFSHTFTPVNGKSTALRMEHSPLLSAEPEGHQVVVVHDITRLNPGTLMEPDSISVASHELLSPLNLISGYTATLLQFDETLTLEQKKRYLKGIESTTNKAVQLVRNLLDVYRLESSVLDLTPIPSSLPELLLKVVSDMQQQTIQHVIKFRQPRTAVPLIHLDGPKIERVISNLLVNASKYSPQGGEITISLDVVRDEYELRSITGTKYMSEIPSIIVKVSDNGMGIPEDELDNVFKKFHRVNNRLTQATPGIGLGLYLCKVIVEAHGGCIWATSKLGEGSTFCFSLPLARVSSAGQGFDL